MTAVSIAVSAELLPAGLRPALGDAAVLASVPHPTGRVLADVRVDAIDADPEVHRWPCLCLDCLPLSRLPWPSKCSPVCEADHGGWQETWRDCRHRARAAWGHDR